MHAGGEPHDDEVGGRELLKSYRSAVKGGWVGAAKWHISVAHQAMCATEKCNSVADINPYATKIMKPMIKHDWGWGPSYFCGACERVRHRNPLF
jgi:hypothetical protein